MKTLFTLTLLLAGLIAAQAAEPVAEVTPSAASTTAATTVQTTAATSAPAIVIAPASAPNVSATANKATPQAVPQALKTYQIFDQQPDKVKFSQGCSGKSRIQILNIYAETRTQYQQAASNKAGRIAQHMIQFAPLNKTVKYAIRVDWQNDNGEGTVKDSGVLSKQEARSGELFWRFSLPGTYRLIWLMSHRKCTVKIGSQFTIG